MFFYSGLNENSLKPIFWCVHLSFDRRSFLQRFCSSIYSRKWVWLSAIEQYCCVGNLAPKRLGKQQKFFIEKLSVFDDDFCFTIQNIVLAWFAVIWQKTFTTFFLVFTWIGTLTRTTKIFQWNDNLVHNST